MGRSPPPSIPSRSEPRRSSGRSVRAPAGATSSRLQQGVSPALPRLDAVGARDPGTQVPYLLLQPTSTPPGVVPARPVRSHVGGAHRGLPAPARACKPDPEVGVALPQPPGRIRRMQSKPHPSRIEGIAIVEATAVRSGSQHATPGESNPLHRRGPRVPYAASLNADHRPTRSARRIECLLACFQSPGPRHAFQSVLCEEFSTKSHCASWVHIYYAMNTATFKQALQRRLGDTSTRLKIRRTKHVADRAQDRCFSNHDITTALKRGLVSGDPWPADPPLNDWTAKMEWWSPTGEQLLLVVSLPDSETVDVVITGWRNE